LRGAGRGRLWEGWVTAEKLLEKMAPFTAALLPDAAELFADSLLERC